MGCGRKWTFDKLAKQMNRKSYPHVTQILSPLFDKSMSSFRARMGIDKANEIIKAKADFGTAVHDAIDAFNKNRKPDIHDDEVQKRFDLYLDWHKRNVEEVFLSEYHVWHDTFRYQGTFDILLKLKGDDCLAMVDVKTPETVSESWALQINAYRQAFESMKIKKYPKIGRSLVLQLTDKSKIHELQSEKYFMEFLRFLYNYNKGERT